jgi:stearoyl-CoA desaturase (delta-9 desaturase)
MRDQLIKYQYLIFQLIAHLTTVWAIYYYGFTDWLLVIPFYILFAGVGISITFHRYCTHQAFVFPTPVKILGLLFGTLNGHGPSLGWAYKHALHHAVSDTKNDPHSPLFHQHFKLYWTNLLHGINSHVTTSNIDVSKNIKPADSIDIFFLNYYWYIHLCYAIIMYLIGLNWLVFAYLVPSALSWFAFGYGVVIASHYRGYVTYPATNDNSKNNRWVSFFVFGEGYQNNHHAHPYDGKYSRQPGELDPLGWIFKKLFARQQKDLHVN